VTDQDDTTTITTAAEGAEPNPFEGKTADEILAAMAEAVRSIPPVPTLPPGTVWWILAQADDVCAALGITRQELLELLPRETPALYRPWPRPPSRPPLQVGDAVGFEAQWCLDQIGDQEGEELARDLALDQADRLDGPCDWCREEGLVLHVDGGLALCCECSPEGL
jgi:hypothetical protein